LIKKPTVCNELGWFLAKLLAHAVSINKLINAREKSLGGKRLNLVADVPRAMGG
jgi:hypothetical protein